MKQQTLHNFIEHQKIISLVSDQCLDDINAIGKTMAQVLQSDGTIFWCGNGGSASDCQHLAAELVGRFKEDRQALSSISLTTDTSILTSVANDYAFENIFKRQIEALARPGDLLAIVSTSGNSPNILNALHAASSMDMLTVGLLGKNGGQAKNLVDQCVVIPSSSTARIQEAHILIGHCLCDVIEDSLSLQVSSVVI